MEETCFHRSTGLEAPTYELSSSPRVVSSRGHYMLCIIRSRGERIYSRSMFRALPEQSEQEGASADGFLSYSTPPPKRRETSELVFIFLLLPSHLQLVIARHKLMGWVPLLHQYLSETALSSRYLYVIGYREPFSLNHNGGIYRNVTEEKSVTRKYWNRR